MTDQTMSRRTCPNGHPVGAAARFCPTCGATAADDLHWQPAGPAWPDTGAAWAAPQATTAKAPAVRRVPWLVVTLVVAAALLLGVGSGAVAVHLNGRPDPDPGTTAATGSAIPTTTATTRTAVPTPTYAAPTYTAPPTPPPASTMIGIVDVTKVRADTRAQTVGTVLNEYFSGINDRDIARTLAVMDPAGVVNRNDPRQVEKFRADVSTTTDTDIVVHWIRAYDTTGGTLAGVTFTSRQDARYGPDGQTCTHWSLTYILSSQFQIVRTTSTNEAC
jgi:hypothetical protein